MFTRNMLIVELCLLAANANGDAMAPPSLRERRADDYSISELQALLQQQAQMLETLQTQLMAEKTRVDSLASKMREDMEAEKRKLAALENGVHNLTYWASETRKQVAFTTRFANDNIQLGIQSTLKFDVIVTNIGSGYSPQTGIFTAPVAGVYVFFLTLMTPNDHGALSVAIVKQGVVLDLVYGEGSGDTNDQASGQVTTHLAGGEQVWVRHHGGDTVIRGDAWTVFTGYLVQVG